jgi:3-dehydroquinate synthase class II
MISLLSLKDALVSSRGALLTGAICVAVCLPLGYCSGELVGKAKARAAVAVATVEVMKVDDVVVTQKEGLIDAVSELPDTIPSARRVALACERLRQQGSSTAGITACGGSTGGTKTPTEG